jgi:hypothetical protein
MLRISDAYADSESNIGLPLDYIRTKMFWEHYKANSYDSFMNLPYIMYFKHLKYSSAEASGQKRQQQKLRF